MAEKPKNEQLELMRLMAQLAKERTRMAKRRTEMSSERSKMSAERSEMSSQRTYMNTERTLSVWIRTALAAMVFGIAVDRLGLLLNAVRQTEVDFWIFEGSATAVTGAILVIAAILITLSATIRFMSFAWTYRKNHRFPAHHKPWLPIVYAAMIVIFGAVLLVILL